MKTLIWEIFAMGSFIFTLSYSLHYMAYQRGLGDPNGVIKPPKKKKNKSSETASHSNDDKTKTGNTFIDKWLAFGGGYYGIVALVELIFIELEQVGNFIKNWESLKVFIDSLGLGWLIGFLIEQLQNFIAAIIWPVNYLSQFSIFQFAVFIGVTYFLYEWTRFLAKTSLHRKRSAY